MNDQTSKSIEASEMCYRRPSDCVQDGILILDFNSGEIRDVNPFLTALLGYDQSEIVGKQLWKLGAIIDKSCH